MSTIQEFENAPVGATAKKEVGLVVIREGDETDYHPWMCTTYGDWFSNEDLVEKGYTLVPSAPTNSREALDLAWELAHPVKPGQVIPKGTRYLAFTSPGLREYTACVDREIRPELAPTTRTLDPLPEPEPDWLNAPAVLAAMDECSWGKPWVPCGVEGYWTCTCCGTARHWSKMADVTPLYPEGTKNDR